MLRAEQLQTLLWIPSPPSLEHSCTYQWHFYDIFQEVITVKTFLGLLMIEMGDWIYSLTMARDLRSERRKERQTPWLLQLTAISRLQPRNGDLKGALNLY